MCVAFLLFLLRFFSPLIISLIASTFTLSLYKRQFHLFIQRIGSTMGERTGQTAIDNRRDRRGEEKSDS